MAVQSWRNRRHSRGGRGAPAESGGTGDAGPRPGLDPRAGLQDHSFVSRLIWLAGWIAALILLVGMGFTYAGANMDNGLVMAVMRAGRWLATPFEEVFMYRDPAKELYANWGLAAAVYYVLGRMLSWLIRR
jgi:hypothetical protein